MHIVAVSLCLHGLAHIGACLWRGPLTGLIGPVTLRTDSSFNSIGSCFLTVQVQTQDLSIFDLDFGFYINVYICVYIHIYNTFFKSWGLQAGIQVKILRNELSKKLCVQSVHGINRFVSFSLSTKAVLYLKHYFAASWSPRGFRKLREACRIHFHRSWYFSDIVVPSYGQPTSWGGICFPCTSLYGSFIWPYKWYVSCYSCLCRLASVLDVNIVFGVFCADVIKRNTVSCQFAQVLHSVCKLDMAVLLDVYAYLEIVVAFVSR